MLLVSHRPFGIKTSTPQPNGDNMNLTALKGALGKVKKPEEVESFLRYVDTMGNVQTVAIAGVVEEVQHAEAESTSPRRVIVVAQGAGAS